MNENDINEEELIKKIMKEVEKEFWKIAIYVVAFGVIVWKLTPYLIENKFPLEFATPAAIITALVLLSIPSGKVNWFFSGKVSKKLK